MSRRGPSEPTKRFDRYIDRSAGPDACWPWTGALDRNGYGRCHGMGFSTYAHRVAYWLFVGDVPGDLHVRHAKCGNPPCCNPSHLAPGTRLENAADALAMGRYLRGEAIHCSKLTEEQVAELRNSPDRLSFSARGRQLGVNATTVRKAITGQTWAHVGASR